jgi:hypothetical protein
MLGHASTTITLDIYSHVLPDMQQDAAEAIGDLLFGEPEIVLTPQISAATHPELLSDLLSIASSSTEVHPQ